MHIALINPEIPFNTGNIGRSCVATGSTLHLIGKLGFDINDKAIRRSGLDYWPKLKYFRYNDFGEFLEQQKFTRDRLIFFSTKGVKSFWSAEYHPDTCLVFGCESAGLPPDIYIDYSDRLYRIPVSGDVRSLNLSASAGIALYHALYRTLPDTSVLKF